jgi:peptidoglycan/xylan/chitin deacetylase (PgdA/CDA1 family)
MLGQFEHAIPVLNDASRKIPATFFLTGKSIPANAQAIIKAYRANHEMANHSYTHPPTLADLPVADIESELKRCQDEIHQLIKKRASFTMAYPNGSGQSNGAKDLMVRNILKKYFIGARATQIKDSRINEYLWEEPFTNDSYFKVNSAMITDGFSISDFASDVDEAIARGGWYCATYHGIETGWVITGKALFTSHMDEIVKKKDQLWIATFKDVVAYHKERNSSRLSVVEESNHKWKLSLTDTLSNNAAYRVPLTIQVKNPSGWSVKSVTQNVKKIAYRTTIDSIQFDAIPDAGEIVFTKKSKPIKR